MEVLLTQLTYRSLIGWRAVIRAAEQCHKNFNRYSFAKTVIELSECAKLNERDIVELAIQIGIKIFPRDKVFENYLGSSRQVITGLPENWTPFLSKIYYSLAYQNPEDPMEYLAIVPFATGKLPHIVHYTGEGYVDPNWFNNVVPVLYDISCTDKSQNKIGRAFKKEKLTLGQVNTINHFFKADPILKILGVCTKCYEVSLPEKGFGVRYYYKGEIKELSSKCIIKEIRFSAKKSSSDFEGSKRPYVTELVVAPNGINAQTENNNIKITKKEDNIWTMLNPETGLYEFSTHNKRDEAHIDARYYDFDKLTMRLPICLCQQ